MDWLHLQHSQLIAQFWTGFAPVGYASLITTALFQSFFQADLTFPIVVFMLIAYKIIKRTRFVRLSEIDVTGGKREIPNLQAKLAEERAEQATWPWWKKIWKTPLLIANGAPLARSDYTDTNLRPRLLH